MLLDMEEKIAHEVMETWKIENAKEIINALT
jgi:hypothetical protein